MAIHLIARSAIEGGGKQAYLEAVAREFRPLAEARGQRLVVLGSTIGSTARWPETTEIWQVEDFAALGSLLDGLPCDDSTHSAEARFWRDSFAHRGRGDGRIVVGTSFSPDLDQQLRDGLEARVFGVEELRFFPGRRREALAGLAARAALDRGRGRHLLLAGEVAFTNDLLAAVWAYRDLPSCNAYQAEHAPDPELRAWRTGLRETLASSFEYWVYASRETPFWPRAERDGAAIW